MNRKVRDFYQRPALIVLACCMLAAPLLIGCGDDESTKPPDVFERPTNLTFINGDNQVSLKWTASPDDGAWDEFVGYNVYRHTETLVGISGTDLQAFKLNATALTGTSFVDGNALNGTKYFYSVRGLRDNGNLTASTDEKHTAPRPQGFVTLAEFAFTGQPSGLDLDFGVALAMSSDNPDNTELIDFYLGTDDENDATDAALTLKSPHLVLAGTSSEWTREARLKLLDDEDASTTEIAGWQDFIVLGTTDEEIESAVIAVRTPRTPPDGGTVHYGKLTVVSVTGGPGQRQVEFKWAYQEIEDYIRF